MLLRKTKKWGNSLAIIIPKEETRKLKLRVNQEVTIEIKPAGDVLKELFGFAKSKTRKSTEQILRETRKDMSKFF